MAEKRDFSEDDPKPDWRYEPKPRGYLPPGGKPLRGGGAKKYVVHVAPADRRIDDPREDPQTPYITGRYQNAAAAGNAEGEGILFHVNQAGKHVEAMFVLLPEHSGQSLRSMRVAGRLLGDGTFSLYQVPDGEGTGKIRVDGEDLLVDFDASGGFQQMRFIIREKRASFLDETLDPLLEVHEAVGIPSTGTEVVKQAERAPLSDAQKRQIEEAFAPERIRPFLDQYHSSASGTQAADAVLRAAAMDERYSPRKEGLDKYVGRVLSPAAWPREQLAIAHDYARTVLANHVITVADVTQSMLQFVESAASAVIADRRFPRELQNVRQLLGWNASGDLPRGEYEIAVELKYKGAGIGTVKVKGVPALGVGVGGYYGTMTVQRLGHQPWRESEQFRVVLPGAWALAGKGKRGPLKATCKLVVHADWKPPDFLGQARLVEGGAWASAKIRGHKVGTGDREPVLILIGSGNHPRLFVPLKADDATRTGLGAEISVMVGMVFRPDHDLENVNYTRPPRQIQYTIPREDRDEVHFDLGSALLKGIGRQRVRMFSALWLPWLQSPESHLKIVGHADTVDVRWRNEELSQMRTLNVLQALRDVLAKNLGIPEARIERDWHGEEEASRAGPDNTPNRRFRRVDVFLNGRCVLVLSMA